MSVAFTNLNHLVFQLKLGNFTSELLGWGYYSGEEVWRNYLHVHSHFEVCYAFRGYGQFRTCGENYPIRAGDLFIAKPDEPHEIIASSTDPLGIYFWSYTLVPPARESSSDVDLMLHAFSGSEVPLTSGAAVTAKTLELLTDEVARQAPGYTQVAKGLVVKLLLETARAVTHHRVLVSSDGVLTKDLTVATLLRYLRDNYNRPLPLKEVAAQVHLSERHTSRLFKQAVGTSIKQYVLAVRLDVAKQRLLNGDSVAEVAYATGYSDVRHFSTLFRQRTGSTPTRYREEGGTQFL